MAQIEALPVLLCGKSTQIATGVIAGLKPEYDVIHVILTPEAGKGEIPHILQGRSPQDPDPTAATLGSKDYSRSPVAVLLGAGYDDAAVEEMRKACKDAGVTNGIPWLRPDTTKPAPPLGPEYGKALVTRIKELMGHLADQHKLDEDAVLYY